MRTIKFRAKGKHNNKWYYGFIWKATENTWFIREENNNSGTPDFEIIFETIGQFTGKKDKDGKEIFEGDIFKDNVGGEDYLIVIYYEDRFGLLSNNCREAHNGMPLDFALHKFLEHTGKEVIGNTQDNPELLEKAK